jgi:hypothetical protein
MAVMSTAELVPSVEDRILGKITRAPPALEMAADGAKDDSPVPFTVPFYRNIDKKSKQKIKK